MANIILYTAEKLSKEYYKVFSGVYNDFKIKSATDYKFELDPLAFDDFIESIEAGLLECIVLLEDNVPTGFLVYTTLISEALELNIIHCLGNENLNQKRKILLEKFLEINQELIKQKIVTYPMLGPQADFVRYITNYNFKLVGLAVVRFYLNENSSSLAIFDKVYTDKFKPNYTIVNWRDEYFDDAVNVIYEAFKDAADALFDPRFKTISGSQDILNKIVSGMYGKFLPQATKVALYENKICGICFANITADTIANIPLVGLYKQHQNKGLGKFLLLNTIKSLNEAKNNNILDISEINASVETDNFSAIQMYRYAGFKEDYSYPQAYLPLKNNH